MHERVILGYYYIISLDPLASVNQDHSMRVLLDVGLVLQMDPSNFTSFNASLYFHCSSWAIELVALMVPCLKMSSGILTDPG